jgi:uncharacterized protein YbjT (DUF2867 family)
VNFIDGCESIHRKESMTILVTGGSGNVGKEVVKQLMSRQILFQVGDRNATNISSDRGFKTVRFDFLDPSTYAPAVAGCDAVFLLRPPAITNTKKTLNVFIDVARSCHVAQIVFISVAGAGDNPVVPHYAVEQHLRAGTEDWTILRPGFFAQNIGDAYRQDIVSDDRIFLPAGSGRVAFLDVRDLAEVAVNALTNPSQYQGQIYTLTGPEAFSFVEVASLLSQELAGSENRIIRYQPASILAYFYHLLQRGMPPAQILIQTILHVGLRFGQAEAVNTALANLLGHQPHTLPKYLRDNVALWL